MAQITKFEFEVELKSPADAFWNTVKDINVIYPKLFPEIYESIQILEGDGKSAGTIRLITIVQDSFGLGKTQKSKIEYVDDENKAIGYLVLEGIPMKLYKNYHETIAVKPKGNGSMLVFTYTYEKIVRRISGPEFDKDFLVQIFKKLDDYTLKNLS